MASYGADKAIALLKLIRNEAGVTLPPMGMVYRRSQLEKRRTKTMPGYGFEEHWTDEGANYDGTQCEECKRYRVLLYEKAKRRICEKCNWDQDTHDYAEDHDRIG